LKAYKQSVITEAVTKGLNPDVPMKDSGIEWICEIPEHWGIAYLKHFCKVNSGREIEVELEKYSDNAVPVYGSGGVFKYTDKSQFNGEAVMFGRKGTLGKPIYVNEGFWAVDTMYYLTFGNTLEARYCFYQLVAFNWEPYITQTALPSIVAADIVNTSFAFPSIEEQQAIADYLDEKCADIDSLIQIKQSKIDSLKEYKKSIIYEYVTGKKEVTE
jgi:type I restriction enzyme S subunit